MCIDVGFGLTANKRAVGSVANTEDLVLAGQEQARTVDQC